MGVGYLPIWAIKVCTAQNSRVLILVFVVINRVWFLHSTLVMNWVCFKENARFFRSQTGSGEERRVWS